MANLKEKYENLGNELVELRAAKKQQLVKFLKERVDVEWLEFKNHRLKIEARLEHTDAVSTKLRISSLVCTYGFLGFRSLKKMVICVMLIYAF